MVSKLCCGASDVLSVINKSPFLSNAKIDITYFQTSLGVRGQLERPPLSYKRSLIATPATGGNQTQKMVSAYIMYNNYDTVCV